jgi:hypothetical protein
MATERQPPSYKGERLEVQWRVTPISTIEHPTNAADNPDATGDAAPQEQIWPELGAFGGSFERWEDLEDEFFLRPDDNVVTEYSLDGSSWTQVQPDPIDESPYRFVVVKNISGNGNPFVLSFNRGPDFDEPHLEHVTLPDGTATIIPELAAQLHAQSKGSEPTTCRTYFLDAALINQYYRNT